MIPYCDPVYGGAVADWMAWAPGRETKSAWIEWVHTGSSVFSSGEAQPRMTFLPMGLRKKLSETTKISLWLGHKILENIPHRHTMPSIFASRHGESQLTIDLLSDIANVESLSPMAFSRSVHNTASGLFGIAEKNIAPSTVISAMENTFQMGLLCALSQLSQYEQVVYIMADATLPSLFQQYVQEPWGSYGVALLLERSDDGFPEAQLSENVPAALSFLRNVICSSEESG